MSESISQITCAVNVNSRPPNSRPSAIYLPPLHPLSTRPAVALAPPPILPDAMAVLDQADNFSNISWHSEGAGAASTAATSSHDASGLEHTNGRDQQQQEPQPNYNLLVVVGLGEDTLECVVSAPITENEGTNHSFVSYLITTHVGCGSTPLARARARSVAAVHIRSRSPLTLSFPFCRPRFPRSKNHKSRCGGASPTSSSSTSRCAATTPSVRCRRSRTSSA